MGVLDTSFEVVGDDLVDIEFVASGGSGTVYRAVQRSLDRVVALKVLHGVDLRDDQTQREARVQAKVSAHANVVTLYGTTTVNGSSSALIMEFVPGGSLADRIERSGRLDLDEWLRAGREVSSALAAAHELGIVHRDVKPSNVLFAADGSARLGDFGISDTGTRTIDQLEASVAFAAPEILEGDRPSAANDLFSLALTLLVAAVGRHPFGEGVPVAAMAARIQSERIRFTDWVPDLPAELGNILDRCLDLEPEERPSAAELSLALTGGGRPQSHVTAFEVGRRSLGLGLWIGISLILALTGSVLVAVGTQSDDRLPPPDGCATLAEYDLRRTELFTQVSSDIERSTSPVDVVDRLLVRHPEQWADVTLPLMDSWMEVAGLPESPTKQQLTDLAVVEAVHALDGDRSELGAWLSSAGSAAYPVGVRSTAQTLRDALEGLGARCGPAAPVVAEARARMYSAVRSGLTDELFMSRFFADPRSFELMTPRLVELLLISARPIVEQLVTSQETWLFSLLRGSDETRDVVLANAPDLILLIGEDDVGSLEGLLDSSAREPLRAGLRRLGPFGRDGLRRSAPGAVRVAEDVLGTAI